MIQLHNFSVQYSKPSKDTQIILRDVNLNFQSGEFVCVLGASGSGKSTFLKALAGLIPSQGQVEMSGVLSMVFQTPTLLPWLNVYENITLPYRLRGDRSDRMREVQVLLKKAGLDSSVSEYFPHQLSGGMKMRVATARALITNPKIILMDEAFSSLDEITRDSLQEHIVQVWREHQPTVFFVTHSLSECLLLAQKILVIQSQAMVEYQPRHDPHFLKKDLQQRRLSADFQKEIAALKSFVFHAEKS